MKSNDHQPFIRFVTGRPEIMEAHRISGEGCYSLLVNVSGQTALNALLDELLPFGNDRINLSSGRIK